MSPKKPTDSVAVHRQPKDSSRPLSALLSQVLVAFTVEFDNEFERQIAEAGYPGARLSLAVWANLMRFVPAAGISVRDLTAEAIAEQTHVKFQLGCLERWGFVTLQVENTAGKQAPARAGRQLLHAIRNAWGSGRGINGTCLARLTTKGEKAAQIWLPLFAAVEKRWRKRFGGDEIKLLRESLEAIAGQLTIELPQGVASVLDMTKAFPARRTHDVAAQFLPTLLSQVLLAFAIEFKRESTAPIALCANVLRVLGEEPVRISEIPRLTGGSPEATSAIGWQLAPYVAVTADPTAKRGKVARLTPKGVEAQRNYHRAVAEIEKRWEKCYGRDKIRGLRESLEGLLSAEQGDRLLISEGLIPPPGTVRAGDTAPALGRRDVGTAAIQRARDLAAQSEEFVRDPAGTLPHYPLWDMNRGFGP
jgi:DNA-binding MarR family transcriptional regulator